MSLNDDLKAELDRKVAANRRRAEELAERHEAGLDAQQAANKRILLFIDHVLPPGSEERLVFEIAWADEIAVSLEEAFSTIVQMKRDAQQEVSPLDRLILGPSGQAARRTVRNEPQA